MARKTERWSVSAFLCGPGEEEREMGVQMYLCSKDPTAGWTAVPEKDVSQTHPAGQEICLDACLRRAADSLESELAGFKGELSLPLVDLLDRACAAPQEEAPFEA